jgi:hypothetical protein
MDIGNFPGREVDHSPPSSAEVRNSWSCISTPHYVFMTWCLVKYRDNFTLPLKFHRPEPFRFYRNVPTFEEVSYCNYWTSLFTTASRTALGPTQLPIQWVPWVLSLGVKRPGRKADHSLPSSDEVKNARSYTSTPQYAFMAWCSVKAQGKLDLYHYFI